MVAVTPPGTVTAASSPIPTLIEAARALPATVAAIRSRIAPIRSNSGERRIRGSAGSPGPVLIRAPR